MRSAVWFFLFTFVTASTGEGAQQPPDDGLPVFLDCQVEHCDFDHVRREIGWVDFVRDREAAQVHLLVTVQVTGAEGLNYTLDYIGRGEFEGADKTLTYVSDPDATGAEVRDRLTSLIAVGLVQYAEASPIAPLLQVSSVRTALGPRRDDARGSDPWDLWVFSLGASIEVDGESQEREYEIDAFVSADRVSEDFKFSLYGQVDYEREEFDDLGDGTSFINSTVDYGVSSLGVVSLDSHWSLGALASAAKSTFSNQDLQVAGGPAVEYNVFPWSESTRRSLVLRYSLELAYFNYELITVESETAELLPRQTLVIETDVQQPWGEIEGAVGITQYLHDLATHRIDTYLAIEYRLFRGLSLEASARVTRIKDQFFLAADDLSPAEVLVRRRQRETSFRYDFQFGFVYRFGSRFANVVNPRFD